MLYLFDKNTNVYKDKKAIVDRENMIIRPLLFFFLIIQNTFAPKLKYRKTTSL